MFKNIIVSILIVMAITACAKKEYPSREQEVSKVSLPTTKDIAETSYAIIRRYVDEEYGNVCYVYIESINCVPLKKQGQ